MALLVLGVLLWVAAHWLKRLAPEFRAGLETRFGAGSKGVVAAVIGVSLVLMIVGYRSSDFIHVYATPFWTVHLNNLMMLFAVALMGAGKSKGRARALMRHPMLVGVIVWAVAHLMVNGDLASVILFGGLGAWGVASIVMINRAEPEWTRPEPGPLKGDIRLAAITVVLFIVITGVHALVGPSPFPG
ncbi:NnrU family protein [Amaricoccus tamworthensis]|uniref:NnrU family protein n=1 Tax=Amaricoccus tamworthensis TaxID=57002 RepID=UPI003C7B0B93